MSDVQTQTATPEQEKQAMARFIRNRIIGYKLKPADQLQANPLNWRKHPQAQRDAVKGSLQELGWIGAVIENVRTGNLIDGHERVWQALPDNEEVPVLEVDLSEEEEKLALAIYDPITMMAETDSALLNSLLAEVHTDNGLLQTLLKDMGEDLQLQSRPPSLDDLRDTYGDPQERDFWPFIRVQVTPQTKARWDNLMAAIEEEDEAVKVDLLLGAIDENSLGDLAATEAD